MAWSSSWPACRASRSISTMRRRWTAPAAGSSSGHHPAPALAHDVFRQRRLHHQLVSGLRPGVHDDPGRAQLRHQHDGLLHLPNAFQFFKMGYASALAWVLFAFIFVFTSCRCVIRARGCTMSRRPRGGRGSCLAGPAGWAAVVYALLYRGALTMMLPFSGCCPPR